MLVGGWGGRVGGEMWLSCWLCRLVVGGCTSPSASSRSRMGEACSRATPTEVSTPIIASSSSLTPSGFFKTSTCEMDAAEASAADASAAGGLARRSCAADAPPKQRSATMPVRMWAGGSLEDRGREFWCV